MNSSQENQIEEGQRSIKEIFKKCKFFQIPIYQRNYSWEEVNCKTLLKDIEEDSEHFTGSLISERHSLGPIGEVSRFIKSQMIPGAV